MRADRRDPVIAALRKHKPTKFEATLRDGTKKQIPLSTKANRWELLSDTLEVIPWVTIEALDNEGQTLGAIEREGEFDDELDPEVARNEGFARIIAGVVSTTMAECRKMFGESMRANQDMARSMSESLHVVNDSYNLAMKIQAATLGQAATPEGEDNVFKMIQMAMMLKQGGTPSISVNAPTPTARPKVNGKG